MWESGGVCCLELKLEMQVGSSLWKGWEPTVIMQVIFTGFKEVFNNLIREWQYSRRKI